MSRDRRSAIGLAIFAIAYLLGDRRYPLDTLATPGPGLFPLIAGLALLALAAWQFAEAGPHATTSMRSGTKLAAEAAAVGPSLAMVGVLIVYAVLFRIVGFFGASLALVFVSARLMGLAGWWRPATLALGITAVSYVLFARWLGVPLP